MNLKYLTFTKFFLIFFLRAGRYNHKELPSSNNCFYAKQNIYSKRTLRRCLANVCAHETHKNLIIIWPLRSADHNRKNCHNCLQPLKTTIHGRIFIYIIMTCTSETSFTPSTNDKADMFWIKKMVKYAGLWVIDRSADVTSSAASNMVLAIFGIRESIILKSGNRYKGVKEPLWL